MFPAQSKNIVSMVLYPCSITYTDFEWGIRFKLQRQKELLCKRNFKILVQNKKKKFGQMRCLRSVRRNRNLGDNMSKVDNEKKPQANRKLKKNKYCIVANILQCHDCIFITFLENKRFLLTVLTLTSCAFVSNDKNIEFSHGFEVISVCCGRTRAKRVWMVLLHILNLISVLLSHST